MQEGKKFRVIVVDSRPHYEGKAMLAKLLANGISCTYLHLSALCYTMQVSSLLHEAKEEQGKVGQRIPSVASSRKLLLKSCRCVSKPPGRVGADCTQLQGSFKRC